MTTLGRPHHRPDNIHYNVVAHNVDYATATQFQAKFSETRTTPICEKPSDYYLAVERFTISGAAIPLFIFRTQEDQVLPKDVNLGIYSVTIEYAGDVQQEFLTFVPRDLTAPVPSPNVQRQERTPYYFVYSYTDMIDMMNAALATAFGNLGAPPVGAVAPWFEYDARTQLISLVAQRAHYDLALGAPIRVYVNGFLFPYIQGMAVESMGLGALPNGRDYQILVTDTYSNWYSPSNVAAASPPDYFRIRQGYNALGNFNDVRSIVFTSSLIPVQYDWVPDEGVNAQPGGDNFRPVITDFTPLLERAGEFRSTLQFTPRGPLRYIDLLSDKPLYRADVAAWWLDDYNTLYPIVLLPGQELEMKIQFTKKTLFSNAPPLLQPR